MTPSRGYDTLYYMKPLFIWAGGKTRLLKKYIDHLPEKFEKYSEPFLGGGAMFVWAYKQNPNAQFLLNDSNESVMNVYSQIKTNLEPFLDRMDILSKQYLPLNKDDRKKFYFALRTEHAFDYKKWSKTEEAASLYFLMKTGFNGIWQLNKNTGGRFGTPSGLLNQKDKVYVKDNVIEWHEALQKTELRTGDFTDTMDFVNQNTYVFLDPPYRGSFTQYSVNFDDKLQESVLDFFNTCKSKGAYALLSNREDIGDDFFKNRKGNNNMIYIDVTYTAGRRKRTENGFEAKKAREILMF